MLGVLTSLLILPSVFWVPYRNRNQNFVGFMLQCQGRKMAIGDEEFQETERRLTQIKHVLLTPGEDSWTVPLAQTHRDHHAGCVEAGTQT